MAAAVVIGLVAVIAFRLFPLRDVTVLNNGEAIEVNATFDPRTEGLAAAAVDVAQGDRVLFATGGRHASVAVQRAREVLIDSDGGTLHVRTRASTVGGALAAAGVELRPGDRVYLDGHISTTSGPLLSVAMVSRVPREPAAASASPSGEVRISIARSRPATIYIDRLRLETSSSAATVEGVLNDVGLTVREGDLVRPALDTPFTAGMTIRLAKAKTITVLVDGKEHSLYTLADTVDDVLRLLGVEIGPGDEVFPPAFAWVFNGSTVTIGLTRIVDEEAEVPVPAPIRYETDASLAPGSVRIVAGREGARLLKYRVTYKNGVEVAREPIEDSVVRDPVATRHITSSRSAGASRPTISAADYSGSYVRKLTVVTTWYNASHGGKAPDDPAYGITATGMRLDHGVCATDPSVIPLGTVMYIPKYGKCVAADVGGGVQGNHVDLGFPESAGPAPWGTEVLEIYILP